MFVAFKNESWADDLTDTHIALIPKVSKLTKVLEFRPISLCNIQYKIIAKVLANRLKGILLDINSSTQSVVVPSKLISNNVIVAYESMHTMKCKLSGMNGFVALKFDMSKTYDKIE